MVYCENCGKEMTSRQSLLLHMKKCTVEESTPKNTKQVHNITNVTNNYLGDVNQNNITIINLPSLPDYLTKSCILDALKSANIREFAVSDRRTADFVIDKFLSGNDRPLYLCTDKQRKNFVFIGQDSSPVVDKNSSILSSMIKSHGFSSMEAIPPYYRSAVKSLLEKVGSGWYVRELAKSLPSTSEERLLFDTVRDKELEIRKAEETRKSKLEKLSLSTGLSKNDIDDLRETFIRTGTISAPKAIAANEELCQKLVNYCFLP